MRRISWLVASSISAFAGASCIYLFPYQPDYLCETSIRARCHYIYSCCNANERLTQQLGGYRDENACIDDQLKNGAGACSFGNAVAESMSEGRFVYDAALAQKCEQPLIDALNSCDGEAVEELQRGPTDEDCAAASGFAYGEGTVKEDDPCMVAYECKDPGSQCYIDLGDGDPILKTVVGECVSPREEGDDCTPGDDGDPPVFCEEGTFCNFDAECEEIPETDLLNDGDDCVADSQCKSEFCNEDFVCEDPPKFKVQQCNGNQGNDTEF